MQHRLGELFDIVYRELRPRASMPEHEIRFYPFSNLNNTIRLRRGKIFVRLSDLLEGAPEPVLHAILHILIAKLYRKEIDSGHAARYRKHAGSPAVAKKMHLIRQMRGRKRIDTPKGEHYHLEEIFEDLNRRFFHGLMARPQMTWSGNHSRQSLGHYDPAHNTIVVSRVFDRPEVPKYAIEYLVYHEMLHLRHPVKMRGSRRCVHSREFQADEKLFPQLEEAKKFLKGL
ncbi:MAG TPA: SprT-like domain-containing protein [Candidatus Limnocylindrales bacterium]|nr:SprT-like domain-containing protein [Candidatus Limnocylindrales bacterium]